LTADSPHAHSVGIGDTPLALNGILLFGCPLAGWVDSFGELKRCVLRVIDDVPDRQDSGGALKIKIP
jgi:hypothetical protein